MEQFEIEPFVAGIGFAEAPRWHDGALWFADSHRRTVCRCAEDGSVERLYGVPAQPCGLGWLPGGELLVVSMWDRSLLVAESGGLRRHARIEPTGLGPCNDLVVDDTGRAYVGCIEYDLLAPDPLSADKPPSRLMMVDRDGEVSLAADDVYFPNGMAISADGRLLVLAETSMDRLTAFDIVADGTLSGRRLFGTLPRGSGPDGIAMDASGAVWVACYHGGDFYRIADGGEVTGKVSVPDDRIAIACAVGGDDGATLFCSTAARDMALRQSEPTGRVGRVRLVP